MCYKDKGVTRTGTAVCVSCRYLRHTVPRMTFGSRWSSTACIAMSAIQGDVGSCAHVSSRARKHSRIRSRLAIRAHENTVNMCAHACFRIRMHSRVGGSGSCGRQIDLQMAMVIMTSQPCKFTAGRPLQRAALRLNSIAGPAVPRGGAHLHAL